MPVERACLNCGGVFSTPPSEIRKFCSLRCRSDYRFKKQPSEAQTPVELVCKTCSKTFTMLRSYLDAYHKKYGRDPMYCSIPCSSEGRKQAAEAKQTFTCVQCGRSQSRRRKPGGRIYAQQKFCNRACKADHQRQKALSRFNEGDIKRHIKRHGYVWVSIPSLVTGKKHAVLEHRYVMSKHLGRELFTEETVHHVNGNRQDNSLENLELFSSRHGPGQRVVDKVQFAIEILTLYPDFAKAAGYELRPAEHPSDAPRGIR